MISKSYPYLSIAKKHNVPYAFILNWAGYMVHGKTFVEPAMSTPNAKIRADINEAVTYYRDVQTGVEPFPTT